MPKGAGRARKRKQIKRGSKRQTLHHAPGRSVALLNKLGGLLGELDRAKRWSIGLVLLITVPLMGYYIIQQDIFAQYTLTLTSVSVMLIIGALPRLRLGLSAAYLFIMPLLLYLGNTEYGYTKAIFSLIVISLLAAMWAIEILLRPDGRLNLTRLSWPGLALLGVTLLSLLHAQVFWGDFQYIVLLFYFLLFALLVANTIRSERDFHFLLGALVFSGALAALYGLLQYYGRLPGTPGWSGGSQAILSSFGNKNYLAGFMAYLFVPGLIMLFGRVHWAGKLLALLELALLYMGLLATSSYSAWLGLIVSLVFVLAALWFYRGIGVLRHNLGWAAGLLLTLTAALLFYLLTTVAWLNHQPLSWVTIRPALIQVAPAWGTFTLIPLFALFGLAVPLLEWLRRRWSWALVLLALLAALGFGVADSPWGRRSLIGPVFGKLSYAASVGARFEDWQIGLMMFRAHPIIGIGIGEYKRQFLPYKARYLQTPQGQAMNAQVGYIPRAAQAHNEYVQVAAELGLLGLLAGAFLILMIFWSTLRRVPVSESAGRRFMLLALLGGALAFLSDSVFSFPLHLPANALVFAFLLGALHSPVLGARTWELRLKPRGKRLLAVALITLGLIVSIVAYRDFLSDVALNSGKGDFALGAYQAAAQELRSSVALDVQPGENLLWLAQLDAAAGETAKAEALYRRSLKSFNAEESYYRLAALYVKQQDYQQASHYLDELLEMGPEPDLKTEAQYLRALVAFNQQDWETALPLLKALIKQHPEFERAYIPLGQYQALQKQYKAARATFTTAQQIIRRKLAQVNKILNPKETISLPAQQYYQAKASQARLQKEQATVEQFLGEIPPSG